MRRPLLGLALLAHVALTLGYLFATPAFEAPDENTHYQYAFHLATVGRLPLVPGTAAGLGRPRADELQQGYHPPLYYALLATTMHALGGADTGAFPRMNPDFGQWERDPPGLRLHKLHGHDERPPVAPEIRRLRWLRGWSLLFGLGVILVVHRLGSLAYPGRPAVAGAAALLVACLPKWNAILAAVNNDTLAVLLAHAALLVLATAVARRALRWPAGLGLGVLCGLGLLTKLTTVFVVPAVVLVHLVALVAWPARRLQTLGSGLACALAAAAVAGWFFVRNRLLYGSVLAIDVHQASFATIRVPPGMEWTWIRDHFLPRITESFVGHFGWNVLPPPPGATWTFRLLLIAGAAGFLVRLLRRRREADRPVLVVLLGVALAVFGLALHYNRTLQGAYARYLFPALAAFAVPLAAGVLHWLEVSPARLRRPLGVVLAAAAPLLGALVLYGWYAPRFGVELAPAPPLHASLVGELTTPAAAPRIVLASPADGALLTAPPAFRWHVPAGEPAAAVYTVHLYGADGRFWFGTFEDGLLEIQDEGFDLPPFAYDALPPGDYLWKVRRLPDRARGETVQDVPGSAAFRFTKGA